eukprot:COSAG05_NODE_13958_length_413_cov_0.595541_1_plen_57_part_10
MPRPRPPMMPIPHCARERTNTRIAIPRIAIPPLLPTHDGEDRLCCGQAPVGTVTGGD